MLSWQRKQSDPLTAQFSRSLGGGRMNSAKVHLEPMPDPPIPADSIVLRACFVALGAIVLIFACELLLT